MSPQARWEYMKTVHARYRKAKTRLEKGRILDEFCRTYDCHRKHALRLLNAPILAEERPSRPRRGSPYDRGRLPTILAAIWEATGYLCGQRLKPALKLWLPAIQKRFTTTPSEERLLSAISSATIDRHLRSRKLALGRRIYGTTKPGSLLKHHIPIKTDSWDVDRPGFNEVDLVSHSGDCAEGEFAHTLNMTDVFTGWVERECVLGKAQEGVRRGIESGRERMPFDLLGIDSDNGSEFINDHLWRYCQAAPKLQFTRGRPYKKDDNAHIEQKNWTHVRKLLGYGRFDTRAAVDAVNELYRHELRWFQNLFQPSVKLVSKTMVGSKLVRRYDEPRTPLERVIASRRGDIAKIGVLLRLRDEIDPFTLSQVIDDKLKAIWAMRSKAPKPSWLIVKPITFFDKRQLDGPPHPIDWRTTDRYERLRARETALNTW
jgi:hypothetical protein